MPHHDDHARDFYLYTNSSGIPFIELRGMIKRVSLKTHFGSGAEEEWEMASEAVRPAQKLL